jgi:hypothetical protein
VTHCHRIPLREAKFVFAYDDETDSALIFVSFLKKVNLGEGEAVAWDTGRVA